MIVRLLRHWRIWNAGESAGFDEAIAKELIAAGIAEALPAAPSVESPAAPPSRGRARKGA